MGKQKSTTRYKKKRKRKWDFTFNNYTQKDIARLIRRFRTHDRNKYLFQPEKSSSGTPHLQGLVHFANARTLKSLQSWFGGRMSWRNINNYDAAIRYCSDKSKRSGNKVWCRGIDIEKNEYNPMKGLTLHDWQKDLKETWDGDPPTRTILWIVDEKGGKGKTTFCKWMALNRADTYLVRGNTSDVLSQTPDDPKCVMFNFSRDSVRSVNYKTIENVKDGLFISGKYKGRNHICPNPHVWCFSNWPPDTRKFSDDRVKIINI